MLATAAVTIAALTMAACGSSSSGGTKLALGTEATVSYAASADGTIPAANTTIAVTVVAVRVGTQDELAAAGLQLDDTAKNSTPYYVDAKFTNKGSNAVARNLPLDVEDTKGESVSSTIILDLSGSGFAKCPGNDSGLLNPGESYQSCSLFLVPKGKKIDRVRFVSQAPDATNTFTDWAAK